MSFPLHRYVLESVRSTRPVMEIRTKKQPIGRRKGKTKGRRHEGARTMTTETTRKAMVVRMSGMSGMSLGPALGIQTWEHRIHKTISATWILHPTLPSRKDPRGKEPSHRTHIKNRQMNRVGLTLTSRSLHWILLLSRKGHQGKQRKCGCKDVTHPLYHLEHQSHQPDRTHTSACQGMVPGPSLRSIHLGRAILGMLPSLADQSHRPRPRRQDRTRGVFQGMSPVPGLRSINHGMAALRGMLPGPRLGRAVREMFPRLHWSS